MAAYILTKQNFKLNDALPPVFKKIFEDFFKNLIQGSNPVCSYEYLQVIIIIIQPN